jgi:hypothetical protein
MQQWEFVEEQGLTYMMGPGIQYFDRKTFFDPDLSSQSVVRMSNEEWQTQFTHR